MLMKNLPRFMETENGFQLYYEKPIYLAPSVCKRLEEEQRCVCVCVLCVCVTLTDVSYYHSNYQYQYNSEHISF